MADDSRTLPVQWESLRNIGPRAASWLREAGLDDSSALLDLGPVGSYLAVRRHRQLHGKTGVSLNLLWALAGATEDRHWAELDVGTREGLLREMDARMELEEGVRE